MSLALTRDPHKSAPRRRRRWLFNGGAAAVGVIVLFWTLLPVYNILLLAFTDDPEEFDGIIWPHDFSLEGFKMIWTGEDWLLANFWHQFGNSIIIGFGTMALTVGIGALASFAIGRMGLRKGWTIGNVSLVIYAVPASFLVIPFARLMSVYGLSDTLFSVIASQVIFALPYAVLILHQYGKLIPLELDESARIDGATPLQIFFKIYLPLMAPALAAVATYSLLLAWNEYLYQFVLLSSEGSMTVAAGINKFFDADEAPWNYLMAVTVVFSLPPIAVYYILRRYMVAGLTMGGVKG